MRASDVRAGGPTSPVRARRSWSGRRGARRRQVDHQSFNRRPGRGPFRIGPQLTVPSELRQGVHDASAPDGDAMVWSTHAVSGCSCTWTRSTTRIAIAPCREARRSSWAARRQAWEHQIGGRPIRFLMIEAPQRGQCWLVFVVVSMPPEDIRTDVCGQPGCKRCVPLIIEPL
jgi:hypothetical protein